MANLMQLNKAAQARSDEASANARAKCLADMQGNQYARQDALEHAMCFDAERTSMFTARFMRTGDKQAFIEGICAIHGAIARGSLERLESPGGSALIVSGTFGGIG